MVAQGEVERARKDRRLSHDEDGVGLGDLFSQLFCILPAYTTYVTRLCASARTELNRQHENNQSSCQFGILCALSFVSFELRPQQEGGNGLIVSLRSPRHGSLVVLSFFVLLPP